MPRNHQTGTGGRNGPTNKAKLGLLSTTHKWFFRTWLCYGHPPYTSISRLGIPNWRRAGASDRQAEIDCKHVNEY